MKTPRAKAARLASDAANDLQPHVLNSRQTCLLTGLSRSTLRRYELDHDFPQRLKIGPGRIGYIGSEVIAWILSRPRRVPTARDTEA